MSTATVPSPTPEGAAPALRQGAARLLPLQRNHDRRKRAEQLLGDDDALAIALSHAASRGITAVWTADHGATVELSRLAGPRDHLLTAAEARYFGLDTTGLGRRLARPPVRCAVYERVLGTGTPFDIYRWVHLLDLAAVWRALCLPRGIRYEWQRALRAARLL